VKSHPTAGGMARGAHKLRSCDRKVISAIEEFSLGLREEFADLSCDCKDVWRAYSEAQESCSRLPIRSRFLET